MGMPLRTGEEKLKRVKSKLENTLKRSRPKRIKKKKGNKDPGKHSLEKKKRASYFSRRKKKLGKNPAWRGGEGAAVEEPGSQNGTIRVHKIGRSKKFCC